jgi:hypothetical protein
MACKPKYIDANEVLKHRRKMKGFGISAEDEFWDYAVLEEDIKNMPAADVVEIKHGKWLGVHCTGQYDDWKCSCCGNFEDTRNRNNCGNYCKWCGAKMDLEGDDTNV